MPSPEEFRAELVGRFPEAAPLLAELDAGWRAGAQAYGGGAADDVLTTFSILSQLLIEEMLVPALERAPADPASAEYARRCLEFLDWTCRDRDAWAIDTLRSMTWKVIVRDVGDSAHELSSPALRQVFEDVAAAHGHSLPGRR
jgi:hypothetical protein